LGQFHKACIEEITDYARVAAWLSAVPNEQEKSRLQQQRDAGNEVQYPVVTANYLLEYLFEIGPAVPGAMGAVGLSFSEIESWQRQVGINLAPWEVRAIHAGSDAYANQLSISRDPTCPPPLQVIERDPEKLTKHIKSILR
jgi:hypothetical protein